MGHAFLYAPCLAAAPDTQVFGAGIRSLAAFKAISLTDKAVTDVASVAVAGSSKTADKSIARSGDGKICIAALGTWLPLPAQSGLGGDWLVERYLSAGVHGLARRLQGFFALLIIDQRSHEAHVVTDRCGSLHLYHRRFTNGHAVCTSSAVLAAMGEARLDPVGVHEFVATGIIYEDRSLWDGIKKIGPATVLTLAAGREQIQPYWSFAEVQAEALDGNDAVDATYHGLTSVLKALPKRPEPLISDLTGGYDSRLLLAGLLGAGRPFHTTVSGGPQHPDVQVAGRIASRLGLAHQHVDTADVVLPAEALNTAVRMTDGEYDAFDYARILYVHRRLVADHGFSLNGSFGELARGYWWELLWPHLGARQTLDADMLARRRFAAVPYDRSIFSDSGQMDLAPHMARVIGRAIEPVRDLPNTSQMDCVYYTLRMQRWQGRIASTTNQLWPAFSPIAFAQVLDPILAARAGTRFRSLLVRKLFARHAPGLSKIPLEHGYPPAPASALNVWRFSPLLGHYAGKVWTKLAARVGRKSRPRGSPAVRRLVANAAASHGAEVGTWLEAPMIADAPIFRPEVLLAFLAGTGQTPGPLSEQWRRLVTLEALVRRVAATAESISRNHCDDVRLSVVAMNRKTAAEEV